MGLHQGKLAWVMVLGLMGPGLIGSGLIGPELGWAADAQLGGRHLAGEVCQECHGEDGNSVSDNTAKLSGQFPAYIAKQIRDFKSGNRAHPIMTDMARGLDEAKVDDIAAFFGAQSRDREPNPGEAPEGRRLFLAGDAGRGIAPCATCHGDDAKGRAQLAGAVVPNLAGQHRTYLREQLRNWRSGARANSPQGMMAEAAHPLSDAEIDDLATYLSGL